MISDLRTIPHFADTVASRAWTAWWQDSPVSLAEYRSWVQEAIESPGIPSAFVAHDEAIYKGSAKLIPSDLASRSKLTPWIAALWVDPQFRCKGVASELINAARKKAKTMGIAQVYLCATPENSPYYLKRSFTEIERDVEGLNVFVIDTDV